MRLLLLCLLIPAAALGTAWAAPVPKDKGKPVLYFPTEVGTKIEYKDETGGEYQCVGKITEAETKDDVTTITIEWEHFNKQDGQRTLKEKLAVSTKGVFRVSIGGSELKPPKCLLKLPVKKGDTWDTSFTCSGTKSVGEAVASEPEEVKTPAGTFTAIPVHYTYTIDKRTQHMVYWFAPQMGIVKHDFTGYKQESKVTTLKEFTLPKP